MGPVKSAKVVRWIELRDEGFLIATDRKNLSEPLSVK